MKDRLSLKNVRNKIKELDNQLEYYLNKKEKALLKVLPQATKLKEVQVNSSRKSNDPLLDYVAIVEECDFYINEIQEELFSLQRYEEAELKRLQQYDEVERQVIYYKEELEYSWSKIEQLIDMRKIACSLRTAKRIWKKYKGSRSE